MYMLCIGVHVCHVQPPVAIHCIACMYVCMHRNIKYGIQWLSVWQNIALCSLVEPDPPFATLRGG